MKIKPVELKPVPRYPDKYAALVKPALVAARPRRWIGVPMAVGMLSATVALVLAGCGESITSSGAPAQTPSAVVTETDILVDVDYVTMGEPAAAPCISFIPLFEYGEGTGAIGCVSISAPVFMSEEEAFAILESAFREAGLMFDGSASILPDVSIPVINMFAFDNEDGDTLKMTQGELAPDGLLNVGEGLPVEFVSSGDLDAWQKDTEMRVSVSEYDIKEAAKILAENNPCLIVFYDPMTIVDTSTLWDTEREDGENDSKYYARIDAIVEEKRRDALVQSEELLRAQAQALIEWLREEGLC